MKNLRASIKNYAYKVQIVYSGLNIGQMDGWMDAAAAAAVDVNTTQTRQTNASTSTYCVILFKIFFPLSIVRFFGELGGPIVKLMHELAIFFW